MNKKSILRRLLQLRLATLMILVTLCCLVLAFRQAVIIPYHRQAAAAKQLKEHGAGLEFQTPHFAWLAPLIGRETYRDVVMVKLESQHVKDDDLTALADLPRLERLYLAGTLISDRTLDYVRQLSDIKRLSLWRTSISDEGLKKLIGLQQLQAIDVHATRVSNDGLATLAKHHPDLRTLVLGPRITNDGMTSVAKLSRLKYLNLAETWVTLDALPTLSGTRIAKLIVPYRHLPLRGSDLIHFRELKYLEELPRAIADCKDGDLVHLQDLRLRSLTVVGPELTSRCLKILDEFPAWRELKVAGNIQLEDLKLLTPRKERTVTVLSTSPIKQQPSPLPEDSGIGFFSLWQVDKAGMPIPSVMQRYGLSTGPDDFLTGLSEPIKLITDWNPLRRNHTLEQLTIRLGRDKPVPVDVLTEMSQLKSLTLFVHQLSIDDFQRLLLLPHLQSLVVHVPIVSPEVLRRIESLDVSVTWQPQEIVIEWPKSAAASRSHISSSEPHNFQLYSPTTAQIQAAASYPEITGLQLQNVDQDADLSAIASAPQLTALYVDDSQLTAKQWQQLWNARQLTALGIHNSFLRDQDLQRIENLSKLQYLVLYGVPISDGGMQQIALLSNLRQLTLGIRDQYFDGPYMSDNGLAALGRLKTLEYLTVNYQPLEGRSFSKLKGLNNLQFLDLAYCEVSDRWVQDLGALKSLKHVDLTGTRLTDASLESLLTLSKSTSISAWSPYLSSEAIETLRNADRK